MYGGKAISNKYVFIFFTKDAATEKAYLPIFSLVLGTKSCLETDDLRVLEKCSRLTKYVGC